MEYEHDASEVVNLVHALVQQSRCEVNEETSIPQKLSFNSFSSPRSGDVGITRSQTLPVRKKVQIKSAPLKPPDIGNHCLFPSVEESVSVTSTPKRVPLKYNVGNANNGGNPPPHMFPMTLAGDKKFKTLEAKLTEPFTPHHLEECSSSPIVLTKSNELPSTPSRKTPRSAKLFAELSSDRRQNLDELANRYSKCLDANQCRNILDELEFAFQLFNTSATTNTKSVQKPTDKAIPLLCSTAEQAYFVIKVVINQLEKIFTCIPYNILQLIIDNYPHKIPKPVRKHIDDWIHEQRSKSSCIAIIEEKIPIDFAKTVTFQSEKDGRSNFLQQTDFHAFCKQRDMFYSIRETWTNAGAGGPSEIITDRSKARMSFPPVGGGPANRISDPISFKVQSLFQLNCSPTNLFHMASLFVSHYLLEARAQEVGGVPKDDNMKEFFQSNPTKLLQLNSRFSTTAETLENEQSSNLAFQKQFLRASSTKFVQHVIDRLVMEITEVEVNVESGGLTNPSQICRKIKDSIHLARLLGFSLFLPYLPEDDKNLAINSIERESILQEQVYFRSHHKPVLDLKYYLEKAMACGKLTATFPWVIEYLLQCDPVTLLLPSYQPILVTLLHLYRTLLAGSSVNPSLCNANKNFLRFYLGLLFSSKNFPDPAFAMKTLNMHVDPELNNANESFDTLEDVARNMIEFVFEDTFNRFRRILSWGKLDVSHPAITGEIRHIRPLPASDKLPLTKTVMPMEKLIQVRLESSFFELYPSSMKRSVDFIAERIASSFITVAKTQIFPNYRAILTNQCIFGVRAAEKCRVKISDELSKYLTERCGLSVKLLLEPSVTVGVLGLCQRIVFRKSKEVVDEWIKNYINASLFPDVDVESRVERVVAPSPTPALESKDPPFEVLILVHRTLRRLHSKEKLDPDGMDKILSCQTLGKSSWAFNSLVDLTLGFITFQPQIFNACRVKQLVGLLKPIWCPGTKIINARNLLILKKSDNPRDSWIKLGSLTQQLIHEGIVKTEDLEQQCFELLREDWPDDTHKRISEFLTIVLETFQCKAEWQNESAQVLDWVAWLCSGQPDQD